MDAAVQPKLGMMVSLILMNLTAIALFFFATPASEDIPNKQVVNAENVPLSQANNVVADASIMTPSHDEKVSVPKNLVSLKKTSKANIESLYPTVAEAQTLPGEVQMRVINTLNTSERPAEPPLAIALKKFVGSTNSGVRIFFEGLKNGYTKKRTRESTANNINIKKGKIAEGASESTQNIIETIKPEPSLPGLKVNSPRSTKESNTVPFPTQAIDLQPPLQENSPQNSKIEEPLHMPSPTQKLPQPMPIWGNKEVGSSNVNHETLPSEIFMDAMSRAQKRTNELIYVFSKKVVPAIERMNDRVAEAVRLEKNLDSYTSALINAINTVVCSNTEVYLKHKHSRPRTSAVKKFRHSKPFCSELSSMWDSRTSEGKGSHSKGEQSSLNKRPVFKTLAAHCWHTRHRRIINKMKKQSWSPEELSILEDSERLKQTHDLSKYEKPQHVSEQTDHCEINNDQVCNNINHVKENCVNTPMNIESNTDKSSLTLTEPPYQITIGLEEVLALKSSLEQSSDQGIQSAEDIQQFYSPLNSNPSVTSGMACRSFVIESTEPKHTEHIQKENRSNEAHLNLEQTQSPKSVASQSSELPGDSTGQARHQEDFLHSDFSIVCDSHIGDCDSYLIQKETSAAAACSPGNEETKAVGTSLSYAASHSKIVNQQRESKQCIWSSGNMKNTMELVNVFQRLNMQQASVAMESVCLLVLRIFEAWVESQQAISSLGLSKISLSSWPSTDEVSSHCSRPRTAICRSRIGSGQDQIPIMTIGLPKDNASNKCKSDEPAVSERTVESDHISDEISQTVVKNVVEAAEIQIAERSLKGLRINMLRNPPSKSDIPINCTDSADLADQSGFGDIKDTLSAGEELAASLTSKSRESIKVSKESSAATFYTGQPESSEDAFYECISTMSAGTCGSTDLEVKDSSTLFLERIQEEETKVYETERNIEVKRAVIFGPQAAGSSFSEQSWLTDSGEELITAQETLDSEGTPASDNSSFDVASGTDDEVYACYSRELSADEFKAGKKRPKKKSQEGKDRSIKKKWAAKLLNKFLKKKSNPSNFPSPLSKNESRSQSDSVLKLSDQNIVVKDGESTQ